MDFEYRGIGYHVWEFQEDGYGAESNVREGGRQEEYRGDYEEEILRVMEGLEVDSSSLPERKAAEALPAKRRKGYQESCLRLLFYFIMIEKRKFCGDRNESALAGKQKKIFLFRQEGKKL